MQDEPEAGVGFSDKMSLKEHCACWGLKISVHDGERLSPERIRAFLEGSDELRFEARDRRELYAWVERTLVQQEHLGLARQDKGLVRRYVAKMTGLGRAQMTRLIGQYRQRGEVRAKAYQRHRFATRYGGKDIALLAEVDEAQETLSGPATQKLLQRAYYDFADARFANLAGISGAHLYRLRATRGYRQHRVVCQPTRPSPVSIGERRKPDPQGRPGHLRVTRCIKATIWTEAKVYIT